MANIVIYQKPSCTTCRQVYRILRESGVAVDSENYIVTPLSKKKIEQLLRKMGMKAEELLRKNEPLYKKMGLGKKKLSGQMLVRLMVKYPELMQRPIIEKGSRAILARPAERIHSFLQEK